MPTHAPGSSYDVDNRSIFSVKPLYTGESDARFDGSVPASTVNLKFPVSFDTTALVCCVLESDKDVTLKVNSTGSPTPTINLKAGKPIMWQNDNGFANPFSTSPVTAIYINNANLSAANVKLYFLFELES